MSYNVANFDEVARSEGVQGTVQVSDGNLGFEGSNGVTINSLGDITANAFFGFTTGGGGGSGQTPSLQQVTEIGSATDQAVTVSNSLTVTGNLFVTGNVVSIDTENLIVQDPIIQLANNSTSDTADSGIVFTRPTSNVVIGWRGDEGEVMIGFSNSSSNGTELEPLDDNKLNLKVYGNVETTGLFIGNANLLSNIVNSDVTPGTYGSGTQVPQIVIGNDRRITSITTVPNSGGDVGSLQDVSDTGNTTSNTVQFTNSHTALTTDLTSNVGIKIEQLANVNITSLSEEQGLLYDGSNWVNDYSVRNFAKIRNGEGSTIYRGNIVYIVDGWNANVANVALADATDSTKMPAFGVVFEDILSTEQGVAVTYGKVQHVNTNGFVEGETVYVSNTQVGGFSNVKPTTNGEFIQNVGIVVKSHLSHGVIFVTGVGRTNDIPNGAVSTEQSDMLYMYGETASSRFAKITPRDFRSNLDQVVNTGNITSNTLILNGVPNALEIGEDSNIYFNNAITLHSDTAISSISIGCRSGSGNNETICIGREAGRVNQGRGSVAIGTIAGLNNQGEYSVALGYAAGFYGQAKKTIVLNATGYIMSGQNSEATYIKPIRVENSEPSKLLGYISSTGEIVNRDELHSNLEQIVSTGNVTSNTVQFTDIENSISVSGRIECVSNVKIPSLVDGSSVNIGFLAGSGGSESIAIGSRAGATGQSTHSVAVGRYAGNSGQNDQSVAIGSNAGRSGQGTGAVSIGWSAGQITQGDYSIAIGKRAGYNDQNNYSIVLNATGVNLDTSNENTLYIKPIRVTSDITSNLLGYTTEGEIIDRGVLHSNLEQILSVGNVTSSNITIGGQANVANIYISQSVGAVPTVSSNIITVDQAGHTYKFFRIPVYPTNSLEGITIQNTTDGCQTLVDIYPITGDLDVHQRLTNGGSGPTVLTSLQSNLIINTGNHVMISCVTDLSNTFVNIIGFY
jgi:hypothetical protein